MKRFKTCLTILIVAVLTLGFGVSAEASGKVMLLIQPTVFEGDTGLRVNP